MAFAERWRLDPCVIKNRSRAKCSTGLRFPSLPLSLLQRSPFPRPERGSVVFTTFVTFRRREVNPIDPQHHKAVTPPAFTVYLIPPCLLPKETTTMKVSLQMLVSEYVHGTLRRNKTRSLRAFQVHMLAGALVSDPRERGPSRTPNSPLPSSRPESRNIL